MEEERNVKSRRARACAYTGELSLVFAVINAASLVLRASDVSHDRTPGIAARILETSRLFFTYKSYKLSTEFMLSRTEQLEN